MFLIKKAEVSNLVYMTSNYNNLHRVHLMATDWKVTKYKSQSKSLNGGLCH